MDLYRKDSRKATCRHCHKIIIMLSLAVIFAMIMTGCTSPLYNAAQNNDFAEVNRQLASGADINDPKEPPLLAAAANGNPEMIALLLKKGALINIRSQETGNTPFLQAASAGHPQAMALLLNSRDSSVTEATVIEDRNSAGNTALMEAADKNQSAAVDLLLSKKAEINAANTEGWPPLFFAVRNGNTAMVKLFLDRGAELNARNTLGFTALIIAAAYGHTATVTLLLDRGADIDAIDNYWKQTSLHWATVNGHTAVAKVLLERGIDITPRNKKGYTARQGAEIYGKNDIERLIAQTSPAYRERMLAKKNMEFQTLAMAELKTLPLDQLLTRNELDNKSFVPVLTSQINARKQQLSPEAVRQIDTEQLAGLSTVADIQFIQAQNQIDKYRRDAKAFAAQGKNAEAASCSKAITDLQSYQIVMKELQTLLSNEKTRR